MSQAGNTACKKCLPGTYNDIKGQSQCTPADAGYYTDSSGMTIQLPCQPGSFANEKVGSSVILCLRCRFTFHAVFPASVLAIQNPTGFWCPCVVILVEILLFAGKHRMSVVRHRHLQRAQRFAHMPALPACCCRAVAWRFIVCELPCEQHRSERQTMQLPSRLDAAPWQEWSAVVHRMCCRYAFCICALISVLYVCALVLQFLRTAVRSENCHLLFRVIYVVFVLSAISSFAVTFCATAVLALCHVVVSLVCRFFGLIRFFSKSVQNLS